MTWGGVKEEGSRYGERTGDLRPGDDPVFSPKTGRHASSS